MSDDNRQVTSAKPAPGRAGAPAECVVAHCPTQRQLRRRTRARCAARCGRAAAAAATNGAQAWQRDVRALNLPMGRPHTKAACGQSADGTPHQDASIPVCHWWNHKNRRLASVRSPEDAHVVGKWTPGWLRLAEVCVASCWMQKTCSCRHRVEGKKTGDRPLFHIKK